MIASRFCIIISNTRNFFVFCFKNTWQCKNVRRTHFCRRFFKTRSNLLKVIKLHCVSFSIAVLSILSKNIPMIRNSMKCKNNEKVVNVGWNLGSKRFLTNNAMQFKPIKLLVKFQFLNIEIVKSSYAHMVRFFLIKRVYTQYYIYYIKPTHLRQF